MIVRTQVSAVCVRGFGYGIDRGGNVQFMRVDLFEDVEQCVL